MKSCYLDEVCATVLTRGSVQELRWMPTSSGNALQVGSAHMHVLGLLPGAVQGADNQQ